MRVSVWVAIGIIFSIFEAASDCLEGLPLSVYFGAKTTQRLGPREPARPEVRGEKNEGRWSVRSGTPAVRESYIQDQDVGPDSRNLDAKPSSQEKGAGPDSQI